MPKTKWDFSRENAVGREKPNPFQRAGIDRKTTKNKITAPKLALNVKKSVFVSYAREDLSLVKLLVSRLRNLNIDVVWDQDFLPGDDFEYKIRSSIENATAVLVVWSPISIRSRFVRDEAALANREDKLAPVITDDLSVSAIPLGFGSLQTTRISEFELISQGLATRGVGPRPAPSA